jgi:iron complex outermembrane receptor protein
MLAVQQIGSRYYATGATGNSKLDGYVAGSLSVAYDTGAISLWKGYRLPNLQISVYVNNRRNNIFRSNDTSEAN